MRDRAPRLLVGEHAEPGGRPEIEILHALVELGARDVRHVNGSLLSHLQGTRDLLRAWGSRKALCAAGLYHAVYGTFGFKHALIDDARRAEVAAIIGEEAERIAYVFGACDREYFYREILTTPEPEYRDRLTRKKSRLPADVFRDLCELTLANELEIVRAAENPAKRVGEQLRAVLERMAAWASPGAVKELARVVGGRDAPSAASRGKDAHRWWRLRWPRPRAET